MGRYGWTAQIPRTTYMGAQLPMGHERLFLVRTALTRRPIM